MSLLAKRYATALHALATEQGSVDAVEQQLAGLHAALASPEARALFTSPDITATERTALLDKIAGGGGSLVRNLIGVLQQRRRLAVLFDLYPSWRTLAMAARGEVDGVVETAMALDPAELQALTALAGRLTGKKVQLTVAVHPELLGGARLRLGNVLYDGSLRASLDQLAQKLSQAAV
jgi:F-type H+-transporting ATPase subunit delta